MRALRGPVPASIRIVAQVHVGGQPVDGALGFGSLWVADFEGSVVQVDPSAHRVVRRIPVGGGGVDSVAAGGGAVWATTEGDSTHIARLVRIDPRAGRVTDRVALGGTSGTVAAAGNVVWLMAAPDHGVATLKRIDPATGRTVAGVRTRDVNVAATVGGDYLWTLTPRGVVEQRDLLAGRVLRRVPGVGSAINYSDRPLAADASGLWMLRPEAIVRVTAGGAVRRMPLRVRTLPTLAYDDGAPWVAIGRLYPVRYGLARLDRSTAEPTGSLDLGPHQPKTLVPSPRGLWVVCADGTALLVR